MTSDFRTSAKISTPSTTWLLSWSVVLYFFIFLFFLISNMTNSTKWRELIPGSLAWEARSITPRHTTHHGTPRPHTTAHHGTPRYTTAHHGTPRHTTAHNGTPRHTTAHHGTPRKRLSSDCRCHRRSWSCFVVVEMDNLFQFKKIHFRKTITNQTLFSFFQGRVAHDSGEVQSTLLWKHVMKCYLRLFDMPQ